MTDLEKQDLFKSYSYHLSDLLKGIDFKVLGQVAKIFEEARSKGKTVFLCGNGGSAATTNHFVN